MLSPHSFHTIHCHGVVIFDSAVENKASSADVRREFESILCLMLDKEEVKALRIKSQDRVVEGADDTR